MSSASCDKLGFPCINPIATAPNGKANSYATAVLANNETCCVRATESDISTAPAKSNPKSTQLSEACSRASKTPDESGLVINPLNPAIKPNNTRATVNAANMRMKKRGDPETEAKASPAMGAMLGVASAPAIKSAF